jgi:Bestrophin, RFP-TM, chloride channel
MCSLMEFPPVSVSFFFRVRDAEIRFLRMARGPLAKTQLCWYWLTEFIIREHLNGSTGKVGPPIISRIIQFLSDGMVFYNHCRKLMFVPFPFPHAQLSVIFVIISIPAVAFLMDQYADDWILGSILTFVSVTCLSGIHEVARELENPFRNIPNELPICTLQAQFNEALIVMFSGYHPDHFWDPTKHDHHPSEPTPRQMRKYRSAKSHSVSGSAGAAPAATPPRTPTGTAAASSGGGLKRTSSAPAGPSDQKKSAEFLAMSAKMEEYGKEIERLKAVLEKTQEKKAD